MRFGYLAGALAIVFAFAPQSQAQIVSTQVAEWGNFFRPPAPTATFDPGSDGASNDNLETLVNVGPESTRGLTFDYNSFPGTILGIPPLNNPFAGFAVFDDIAMPGFSVSEVVVEVRTRYLYTLSIQNIGGAPDNFVGDLELNSLSSDSARPAVIYGNNPIGTDAFEIDRLGIDTGTLAIGETFTLTEEITFAALIETITDPLELAEYEASNNDGGTSGSPGDLGFFYDIVGASLNTFVGQSGTNASFVAYADHQVIYTITAVPEPSALAMAGLALGGLAVVGYRRRQAKKS